MLEIIWRNPKRLGSSRVAVLKVACCGTTDCQLRSIYRVISDAERAEVLYELLVSRADPVCAA